jgi:O-antigen ligase
VLLVAVLGVGGAPRPVLALLGALVAGGLALQVTSRRRAKPSPLVFVMATAVVLTALQLAPLPGGLAASIDPIGQELRRDGELLFGEASSWTPLSRDPAGTSHGLAYLLILGGAALLALRIAAFNEHGRFTVVAAVALTGALAALVTAIHELIGATALYGFYRPAFATPLLLGPLLNPNHLGCLFAMSAVASAGLVFHERQPVSVRAFWALCAAGLVAATLTTLSRGATVALLAGGFVLVATLIGQRMRGREDTAAPPRLTLNALAIGVVAMCGLALVVYTSGRGVSEQLRATSGAEWSQPGSKYGAWRSAGQLIAEVPWLGIGRGAFESSFTRIHPQSSKVTYSHPENEYVQAVVEWGLPGALVLAGLVGWLAVAAARRWRMGAVTSAALAGATVVAVQSVVDFGLELPGIGVPVVALLASLVYVPLRELGVGQKKKQMAIRVAAAAVVTVASAALLGDCTRRIADDHNELRARAGSAAAPTAADDFAAAREILERHPHDYLAFAVAGNALARDRDPRAMSFLNQALRLHPTHAGTHRAAARLLLAAGAPHQATLEYATAMRGALVVTPLVQEVVKVFADPELAAMAIPADYPVPEHIARLLGDAKADAVAVRWLRRVAIFHPEAPRIGELLLNAAQKQGDLALAEVGARMRHQHEHSAASMLALGQILVKRDKLDDAAAALADVAAASGSPEIVAAAWLLSCDVEEARGRWATARTCLLALRERPQRGDAMLLEIARRLARVEAGAQKAAAPASTFDAAPPTGAPR